MTVLTATMIIGILSIVALLAMRITGDTTAVTLPDQIVLPDGATATAFTQGKGWYAVVVDGREILIYVGDSHALRQTIKIAD